jgi:Arabinose-binding domain of AraC transcription regulator, N-term
VTDGAKRTGPLLGLPGLLRELGQAPDTVFAAAGLDSHIQDDPEGAIDFSALGRVIQQCVEATGCPHFGLLWGQSTGISALGLVGMLRQHSPDLGTAVRNVILCFHIHDRGAVPRLTVSGSTRRIVQACVQAP